MRQVIGVVAGVRRAGRWAWQRTVRSELGEGVISAAIAVLIMAFLGVGMWFGFRATLGNTQRKVDNQVTQIGTDNGAGGTGASTGIGGTGVGGTGVGGTAGGTGVGGTGVSGTAGSGSATGSGTGASTGSAGAGQTPSANASAGSPAGG